MGAHDQRPSFYEGQFLSAADLDAAVSYPRVQQARHQLGAHTWGIATGLTLLERPAPGAPDRVEVIVQPGLAWDGFGRSLIIERPQRLDEALFESIAYAAAVDAQPPMGSGSGRLVKLWMRYDELAVRPPQPGFEPCGDADTHARVQESFAFGIGDQPGNGTLRANVTVGTVNTPAENALTSFDPAAATLWDSSVPHQTFPEEGRPPVWWLPLGLVRWVARDGALGYFARRDLVKSDNAADRARALRRYVGTVAQNIESADGAVVVHRRDENPLVANRLAKLLASGYKWDDLKKDLLWVEGHARIVGDAKLAGGALLLRDGDGGERKTPLYVSRWGDHQLADGARELRVAIGPDTQIDNRLVVGPELPGASPANLAPRLVVTSGAGPTKKDAEGRVGVNTRDPAAALEVRGNWDGAEDGALRLSGSKPTLRFAGGGDEADAQWIAQLGDKGQGQWRLAVRTQPGQWAPAITATTAQRVGIGTDAPTGRLTVEGLLQPQQGKLSIFTASADIEYDGGGDQLFVVRQAPAGVTSLQGMKLGVETAAPAHKVHVKGDRIRLESTDGLKVVDLRADGSQVDLQSETSHLYLRSTTPAAQGAPVRHVVVNAFPEDGLVGIGRVPVSAKLEVDGQVRLGPLAALFAMGCNRAIRAVIGAVDAGGNAAANLQFSCARTGMGNYTVNFAPAFAAPPVVLATPIDSSNDDNLLTVRNVTAASFQVIVRDVVNAAAQASNTPEPQDGAFSFVAFGAA